jgi:hypothetical protein
MVVFWFWHAYQLVEQKFVVTDKCSQHIRLSSNDYGNLAILFELV